MQKSLSPSSSISFKDIHLEKSNEVTFAQKLLVGGFSGMMATSLVYPLDMIKTTMQRQVAGSNMLYRNPFQAFRGVIAREGCRGLYRGMGVNITGVFPVQAVKLASNDLFRDLLADENGHVSTVRGMIAGAAAGGVQVIASNPMEILKIRTQIQSSLPIAERRSVGGILRELGIRGLYKGSSITLMRDIPYFMLFFPLNHALVDWFTPRDGSCPLSGLLLSGCGAGMTSAFLMTPMDVLKTRVQAAKGVHMSSSFWSMFKSTVRTEGVRALFKGASMRMLVQAPMFGIMTTAFELQKRLLSSH